MADASQPRIVENIAEIVSANQTATADQQRTLVATVGDASQFSTDELCGLLAALSNVPPPPPNSSAEQFLDAILTACHRRCLNRRGRGAEIIDAALEFYRHLGAACQPRRTLLAMVASTADDGNLSQWAQLFSEDPPLESTDALAAIAPLFQRSDYDPAPLFPQLFEGLAHPHIAPAVLDLANYLTRSRKVSQHPARQQQARLISLLKGVCARLREIETEPVDPADVTKTGRQIGDSVAIACSLCDALGLIGDESAGSALHDALALKHRRIRVEAAAALARLGDDEGAQALAQLAEYPVSRLRAIAFAEELGLEDHLDPQWQTPLARAEAELACFLAEPQQLGAPPSDMELLDERTLAWPSYDQPQMCHLFRFTYQLGDATYTNVGIVGPLVHALHVDATVLSTNDLYALFAGWQAEHPEIQEVTAEQLDDTHQALAREVAQRLAAQGFELLKVVGLGIFFGEAALIAVARRGAEVGAVVAGADEAAWFPRQEESQRPLGPEEAWCVWKGRQLLRNFNEDFA